MEATLSVRFDSQGRTVPVIRCVPFSKSTSSLLGQSVYITLHRAFFVIFLYRR